jgi:3-dehydroquinate synthase class II
MTRKIIYKTREKRVIDQIKIEDRPAIILPIIDRKSVRQLVIGDAQYVKKAAEDGKNIHQVTLDRQDQVNEFMAGLSETDLENFLKLYLEEMGASTQAILDETKILEQSANIKLIEEVSKQGEYTAAISIVIIFAAVLGAMVIFK